jgi:hypothetical protein
MINYGEHESKHDKLLDTVEKSADRLQNSSLSELEQKGADIMSRLKEGRLPNRNLVAGYGTFQVEYVEPIRGRDGGPPNGDPDSGGRVIITRNGRRRIISLGALAILLGILGIVGKKIYEDIANGKKVNVDPKSDDDNVDNTNPSDEKQPDYNHEDREPYIRKIYELDNRLKNSSLSIEDNRKSTTNVCRFA